jgi:ribonuclease HI
VEHYQEFLVTSKVAEVLAALHAMETCKKMGFHDIILEGDVLQIVYAIKAIGHNCSSFGHIVDRIKLGLRQPRSW